MAAISARKATILGALAAALAVAALHSIPNAVAEASDTATVQADENAEPFPLEARSDPEEMLLSNDPKNFGQTQPVRVMGNTLPLGDKGVRFNVTFRYEEGTDLEPKPVISGEIPVTGQGTFDGVAFTPDNTGIYTIDLTAPDGRGQAKLEITVHEPPDEDEPDEAPAEAGTTIEEGLETIEEAIDELPESPAKTEAKGKLARAKAAAKELASDPALGRSISGTIGAIRSDPALTDYARPRLGELGDGLAKLRAETKRVKAYMGGMSSAEKGCHQLAMISEGFKLVSALLNIKKSVIDIASGLAKDVIADFAGNAAKAKGASSTTAFAVGQIAKNSPELNRLSGLSGNIYGIMADLGGFLTDTAFSMYCEQFTGPVSGRMEARFFQPEEWWSFKYEITGRIVLYYPKNAAGKSIRVTGRIEGVAHSFHTEENALSVLFPKLMASTIQKKINFPTPDVGAGAALVATQGTGASSGYIEGSAAGLALPGSFLMDVTGLLEKDSMSIILGAARSDIHAKHRVGVFMASPLILVPVFSWYELPYKDVHHLLLRASQGQAMRVPITTSGKTMTGEARFDKPAPGGGEARGAYSLTIKLCNPGC